MNTKIKYIFSDIDGVLTDGKVRIDINGNETKEICYRDLDSVAMGRQQGLEFIFVTGEDTIMARQIVKRFKAAAAEYGAKDKLMAVQKLLQTFNISRDEVCYIGDSNRDVPAIAFAGFGVAPSDASPKARKAAAFVTETQGGSGVLFEVVEKILDNQA